jgi:Putative MetA-pathway of phenol degradation
MAYPSGSGTAYMDERAIGAPSSGRHRQDADRAGSNGISLLSYSWASGSAKLGAQEKTRDVSGPNDPKLRFSMLLYGGPALSLEEFRDYKPDFIIGASLEVTAPLGQYNSDKLLNVGTNRWSFKPEIGLSKTLDLLTLELATGIRFYTDNNDFLDGKTLQISPLYSVQGHLIYSFTPGLWVGLDGLYYTGGRPTINGNKGESNENARVGLTCTLPVNKYNCQTLWQHRCLHEDRNRLRHRRNRMAISLGRWTLDHP